MAALTTALVLGGLAVAKGVNDIISQQGAARAAQQEGDYAAGVYGRNADLADEQAKDAIARGRQSEMALRRKSKGLASSQRASFAAQGIDVNDGSAQDVAHSDAALSELDALTIRNNAQREALGYTTQAQFDRQDAANARRAGRNRAGAIRKEAIGTLLTTGTSIAGAYERNR